MARDSLSGAIPKEQELELPSSNQSFKDGLQQFAYQTPSPSPLKREAPSSEERIQPPSKRITRSASAASLRSEAISKQTVFPPPVNLSPSPHKLGTRSVSSPSPSKTPPKATNGTQRKRSKGTVAPSSPSPSTTNLLTDELAPNLHIMFVGSNPGMQTATTGFAYAHPTNLFYPLLHISGITSVKCYPNEYRTLVERFGVGNTNIVTRPTKNASMLSKAEMEAGVAVIEEKARKYKPACVCLVGKSIWDACARVWKRDERLESASNNKSFEYGWQDIRIGGEEGGWEGARVFAATSTSGLAITVSWDDKVRIWEQLGNWYQARLKDGAASADV